LKQNNTKQSQTIPLQLLAISQGEQTNTMKKQTAVEWIVEQVELISNNKTLSKKDAVKLYDEVIQQAKAMEKEQTLDFTRNAVRKILDEDRQNPFNLEQYYNETYGGDK
jgi:GTP-dependent phosphoenolpyruvate carboxykinase